MNTNSIRSRDTLMKAFAVAEMVAASLPEVPDMIAFQRITLQHPVVRLYFHRSPQRVVDFGNQHNVATTTTTRPSGIDTSDREVHTEATVDIDGVTVEAWSLTVVGEVAA